MFNISGLRCIKTTFVIYCVEVVPNYTKCYQQSSNPEKSLFYSVIIISVETSDDDDESGEGSQQT